MVRLVLLGHLLWGLVIAFTVTCVLLGQICFFFYFFYLLLLFFVYCLLSVTGSVFQAYYRTIIWLQDHSLSFKATLGGFRSWAAITQVGDLPMVTCFCICSAWAFHVTDGVTCSESPPHQFMPRTSGLWNEKPSHGRFGGTEMAILSLKGQKKHSANFCVQTSCLFGARSGFV